MGNELILDTFRRLSTALIGDACIRLDVPVRLGPPEIRALAAEMCLAGSVRPVRHAGSVDVFLEAADACSPGEVLVIDNGGRMDEGCIEDLTALEVRAAEMSGLSCGDATAIRASCSSSACLCSAAAPVRLGRGALNPPTRSD